MGAGLLPRWFSYMALRPGVVPLAGLCGQREPLAGLCDHFWLGVVSGCVPWQGGVTGWPQGLDSLSWLVGGVRLCSLIRWFCWVYSVLGKALERVSACALWSIRAVGWFWGSDRLLAVLRGYWKGLKYVWWEQEEFRSCEYILHAVGLRSVRRTVAARLQNDPP